MFGSLDQVVSRVSKQNSVIRIFISGEITQHSSLSAPDEYTLKVQPFSLRRGGFALDREETLLLKRTKGRGRRITLHGGQFEIITEIAASSRSPSRGANQRSGEINKETSALSVLRRIGDRTDTKQVSELADVFEGLRLFDPNVERARLPSSFAADESKHLRPDASNLAGVLRTLHEESPDLFKALEEDIRVVLPGFKEFKIEELAGGSSVAISLVEQGLRGSTPLSRASFGTVRAIALFAMLRDPEPPRLTCLEEVDHGLHPYALDVLVDRVREASTKGPNYNCYTFSSFG